MRTIRDLMEKWARWRVYLSTGRVQDSLGRLMAGVPGTGCPTCAGKGKIPGWKLGIDRPIIVCPTCSGAGRVSMEEQAAKSVTRKCTNCGRDGMQIGEVNYGTKENPFVRTCPFCLGRGTITTFQYKVNPASIPSTRHMQSDGDPVSERIDWIVCGVLNFYQKTIIMREFTEPGTQEVKANREGVSQGYYSRTLSEALTIIDGQLRDEGVI